MAAFHAQLGPLDNRRRQLTLSGELDLATAPTLVDLGLEALARPGTSVLAIDVGEVTFIDSTALGALVRLRNAALAGAKRVELVTVPDRVQRLLELTGLSDVFAAEADESRDQPGS